MDQVTVQAADAVGEAIPFFKNQMFWIGAGAGAAVGGVAVGLYARSKINDVKDQLAAQALLNKEAVAAAAREATQAAAAAVREEMTKAAAATATAAK